MNHSPPSLGGLSRLSGGTVVLRHKPDQRNIRDRIAQNEAVHCTVEGCGYPRYGFGGFCSGHLKHYQATGHPTAKTIRRGAWRPWVMEASGFVSQQLRLDHVGIADGVSWCAKELFSPPAGRRNDPKRPHVGYSLALANMRRGGVGPDDMLARFIAAYAFRQWADTNARSYRLTFANHEHFAHQASRLYLHPRPLGAPRWAQGSTDDDEGAPERDPRRIIPSVRRFTYDRVNVALGVLALKAAEEINKRLLVRVSPHGTLPPVSRVEADTAPFYNPNSTESTK